MFGDLIFTTADGGPIGPRNFYRRFKEIAGVAGLPAIPLHGLRHAHATQLLRDGVALCGEPAGAAEPDGAGAPDGSPEAAGSPDPPGAGDSVTNSSAQEAGYGVAFGSEPKALLEHPSVLEERSVTPAMPLRHLQVDVAEPKRAQLPFDNLVGRAGAVAEVRILMRPASRLRQGSARYDAHLARSTSAKLPPRRPQRFRQAFRGHVESPVVERPG